MSLPFWLASQFRKPFTLRQVQRRCLNYSPPPKPESGPREIVFRNLFKKFGLDKIPLWDWNIGWVTKPWPRSQSFTSLNTDLRQDINRVCSFSHSSEIRGLRSTKCSSDTLQKL